MKPPTPAGLAPAVPFMTALVLLALMVGCTAGEQLPAAPTVEPTQRPAAGTKDVLTRGDLMRAIRARSRAASGSTMTNESYIRTYDASGNVVSERVFAAGKWVRRASTLPASLASLPLRSFLTRPGGSLASAQMHVSAQNSFIAVVVDTTIQSVPYYSVDTLWSDNSAVSQSWTHDDDPNGIQLADITYSSLSNIGKAEHATAMYSIMEGLNGGDEWTEYTLTGSALADAHAEFVADTSGAGIPIRMNPATAGREGEVLAPTVTEVPLTSAESTDVAVRVAGRVVMYSSVLEKANCNEHRITMKRLQAASNFLGVLVVATAYCPPCQVPGLVA